MPQPKRLYPPVIINQPPTKAYEDGWDRVFSKKEVQETPEEPKEVLVDSEGGEPE